MLSLKILPSILHAGDGETACSLLLENVPGMTVNFGGKRSECLANFMLFVAQVLAPMPSLLKK